ncbi:hypothetical protein AGR1A_Cc20609 [Agrobacterium fabacearum CFBP 5771]|nr:hypothetical protein AGR1A_Cc20609 [Agrobacterium fabacearum CFBP 5771]
MREEESATATARTLPANHAHINLYKEACDAGLSFHARRGARGPDWQL